MIDINIKIKTDTRALKRLSRLVAYGSGAIRDVFVSWGKIYRGEMRKRFMRLSRGGGGGEWPALKPATIQRRRHGKSKGRRASILWDTGTLLSTLNIAFAEGTGQYQRVLRDGVGIGISDSKYHPKAPFTVGALAAIHHFGVPGRIPARPILVQPDGSAMRLFARALDIGLQIAVRESQR